MKFELNKKTIISISIVILLLSALIYNLLYINNKKNEIIEEINFNEQVESQELVIEKEKTIFVDVGGEVLNPGLYELSENSRINDAIKVAGGTTDKADLESVNLAYILSDAMKIIIPKKESKKVITSVKTIPKVVTTTISTQETNHPNNNLVNINNATKEQLKTLTGIGDTTAQKIIDHRNENGNFKNIEELKNVSGIGDSKYEKIKDKITI